MQNLEEIKEAVQNAELDATAYASLCGLNSHNTNCKLVEPGVEQSGDSESSMESSQNSDAESEDGLVLSDVKLDSDIDSECVESAWK